VSSVLFASFSLAFAHGPPAAALGVASWDDVGPVHVALSEGLAVRTDAGFRYVCPTRWGGSPLGPFAGGSPARLFLPGADDLYGVDAAGQVDPLGDPAHGVAGLLDLEATWGIWIVEGGREIASLDPGLSVLDPIPWSGILGRADGADVVAGPEGVLVHRRIDAAGAPVGSVPGFALVGTSPQLVGGPDERWVVDRASGYVGVHALETGALVGTGAISSAGPVRLGEAVYVAFDGLLWAVGEGAPTRTAEQAPITCLDGDGARGWACSRDLYALAPDGTLGAAVVALDRLEPPDVADLAESPAVSCWGEWRTFALDLGIDPGVQPAAPETASVVVAEGACASGPRTGPAATLTALSLFRLTTRIRRGTVRVPARRRFGAAGGCG
jgi:hypothetical protein